MGGVERELPDKHRPDSRRADPLSDPARVQALADLGLSMESDPELERFAERVRCRLGVPVALVSLVQPDQQVFPGMAGLPEPWASKRSTPLTHSFCQHVVRTAAPLIVEDAREDPLVRDNLAVPDLGVIAYAGMPLTDSAGNVLGSLCAIDVEPRRWTTAQLDELRDLAAWCSTELRLRLARHDGAVERRRRDQLGQALRRSFDRSQTLLRASQAFTETITVEDVRARVSDLVTTQLRPTYVGLVVLDDTRRMQRLHDTHFPPGAEDAGPWIDFDLTAPIPTATAARENRLVHYPDREAFDAEHPEPARQLLREVGLHACLAAPLPGPDGPIGAVVLGWDTPRPVDPVDQLTITTIAGYAAQALARARRLAHRISVAHQLQHAMLTTLPEVSGLALAARYQPADAREQVGGDWYDAFPTPDPDRPDRRVLTLSIGDIIGHELAAATFMGQTRSMLRQAAWSHPEQSPSHIFRSFEHANLGLDLRAAGTAILARLAPTPTGSWSLTWTNAGHPAPILLVPGRPAELLEAHDILFGYAVAAARPRTDNHRTLAPGSTLFLYTDGLVERRGSDLDAGVAALIRQLEAVRERAPRELVDATVDALAVDRGDDVVAFALTVG